MNEPKKRGRPSKAEIAAREAAIQPVPANELVSGDFVSEEHVLIAAAQAYALRVWNGQSPDVPRNERLKRVAKALEGQGMSMEGVQL